MVLSRRELPVLFRLHMVGPAGAHGAVIEHVIVAPLIFPQVNAIDNRR